MSHIAMTLEGFIENFGEAGRPRMRLELRWQGSIPMFAFSSVPPLSI
jgi:hypothetical protein